MKCLICTSAEIASGFTSITFTRGEFRMIFNNVPAQICPNCNEAYMDEETAERLLRDAESVFDEGVHEDIREY